MFVAPTTVAADRVVERTTEGMGLMTVAPTERRGEQRRRRADVVDDAGVLLATDRLAVVRAGHQVTRPMIGAEVGGDPALEAERALEDRRLGQVVRAAVDVVDAVVGAHDGPAAGRDGLLERLHLAFVERPLVDVDAGRLAAVLEVVVDEVLELGDDAFVLRPEDLLGRDRGGQVLVLTEGLEVPTARRDDDLVHHRAEPDGLALAAVVRVAGGIVVAGGAPRGSPRRAVAVRSGRIKRRGQPDRGGQRGRLGGEANARGAVREMDVRDAQTDHAGRVPYLAGTCAEGAAAVGEVVRLSDGHHADELVELGVGQRAATPDGPGAGQTVRWERRIGRDRRGDGEAHRKGQDA